MRVPIGALSAAQVGIAMAVTRIVVATVNVLQCEKVAFNISIPMRPAGLKIIAPTIYIKPYRFLRVESRVVMWMLGFPVRYQEVCQKDSKPSV